MGETNGNHSEALRIGGMQASILQMIRCVEELRSVHPSALKVCLHVGPCVASCMGNPLSDSIEWGKKKRSTGSCCSFSRWKLQISLDVVVKSIELQPCAVHGP